MKRRILRDLERRRLFSKYELEANTLKAIVRNEILPFEVREKAWRLIHSLPRDASITRINNVCRVTGRTKGVLKKFGVSRIVFRKLVEKGELPGIRGRSSW